MRDRHGPLADLAPGLAGQHLQQTVSRPGVQHAHLRAPDEREHRVEKLQVPGVGEPEDVADRIPDAGDVLPRGIAELEHEVRDQAGQRQRGLAVTDGVADHVDVVLDPFLRHHRGRGERSRATGHSDAFEQRLDNLREQRRVGLQPVELVRDLFNVVAREPEGRRHLGQHVAARTPVALFQLGDHGGRDARGLGEVSLAPSHVAPERAQNMTEPLA